MLILKIGSNVSAIFMKSNIFRRHSTSSRPRFPKWALGVMSSKGATGGHEVII